jgi:hypothetical protein
MMTNGRPSGPSPAVRDDECRAVPHQAPERVAAQPLELRVEVARTASARRLSAAPMLHHGLASAISLLAAPTPCELIARTT